MGVEMTHDDRESRSVDELPATSEDDEEVSKWIGKAPRGPRSRSHRALDCLRNRRQRKQPKDRQLNWRLFKSRALERRESGGDDLCERSARHKTHHSHLLGRIAQRDCRQRKLAH